MASFRFGAKSKSPAWGYAFPNWGRPFLPIDIKLLQKSDAAADN